MLVEVSNGELLDKFSILKIKLTNITDSDKIKNIENEIKTIEPMVDSLFTNLEVLDLSETLLSINKKLWDIEDDIRWIGIKKFVYSKMEL